MFDSPLEWCGLCAEWIALDQGLAECARQHGCTLGPCPLKALLERCEAWRSAAVAAKGGAELH